MSTFVATSSPRNLPYSIVSFSMFVYVNLWILEGAIRKWVTGTESLFYVLRDLLTIAVILLLLPAIRIRRSAVSILVLVVLVVGFGAAQLLLTDGKTSVAIVGLRSYIAPTLFVVLAVGFASRMTLNRALRIVLYYAPVQAVLCIIQVLSPMNSWFNRQVGVDEASFVNFGVVRVSGSFSAPAGLTLFVVAALVIALISLNADEERGGRLWAQVAVASALIIAGVSGSRGTLLAVAIIGVAYVAFTRPRTGSPSLVRWIRVAAVTGAAVAVLAVAFPAVVESFTRRFETAAYGEDSGTRIVEQTFGFLSVPLTFLGTGMGANSQAGIGAGSNQPWSEVEGDRWVLELGILGFIANLVRIGICLILVIAPIVDRRLRTPSIVLLSAGLVPVLAFGQITQTPSTQGFVSIFCAAWVFSYMSARDNTGDVAINANQRERVLL